MADSLYQYLTEKGLIVPDTSDIKQQVEEEFKDALGNDLNLDASTPQGRLIEAETLGRIETLRINAAIANCFNPNSSFGIFLDALSALTGCYRKNSTQTVVVAKLGGVPGTEIPAGSEASNSNDDIFVLINDVVIGEDGECDGIFASKDFGSIPCSAGDLSVVRTTVIGWETVTNPLDGILGAEKESDYDLKRRRLNTLYNGRSFLGDVKSKLANVENIQSFCIYHNYRSRNQTYKGVTLKPHSLYVCAYGGADEDIAMALYMTNSAGCDYSGDTTVMVTDPWTEQEYEVAFDRPNEVEIDVKVYVKVDSGTGNVKEAINAAILDYQYGNIENVDGLQVGQEVSPFEISSAINIAVPGVFVNKVMIAKHGKSLSSDVININLNEIARIKNGNITIRFNS